MKYILLLAVVLLAYATQAQLTKIETPQSIDIGKVKRAGMIHADLSYSVEDGDTTYSIYYRNVRYTTLRSYERIKFSETGNTLNDLYSALKDAMNAPKKTKASFQLGDDDILVVSERMLGNKMIYISTGDGLMELNATELEKLFGKK